MTEEIAGMEGWRKQTCCVEGTGRGQVLVCGGNAGHRDETRNVGRESTLQGLVGHISEFGLDPNSLRCKDEFRTFASRWENRLGCEVRVVLKGKKQKALLAECRCKNTPKEGCRLRTVPSFHAECQWAWGEPEDPQQSLADSAFALLKEVQLLHNSQLTTNLTSSTSSSIPPFSYHFEANPRHYVILSTFQDVYLKDEDILLKM